VAGEYIVGLGGPSDQKALKLETRKHRWIHNVMQPETNPNVMRVRIKEMQQVYEHCRPVSASTVYNCHGLVFAARRTSIVDDEDVNAILEDDGYHPLPWDPDRWLPGDIVLYRDKVGRIVHSGIIVKNLISLGEDKVTIEVLSVWGEVGEYIHPIDEVPVLLGKATDVVSQRFLT
jgi:hypothetical protein